MLGLKLIVWLPQLQRNKLERYGYLGWYISTTRHNKAHTVCKILMMSCITTTVYPKKYAHGFVVLWFVVVMQSFIMNSHEVFIHIHQGCFAGTGAIVRLPQCQWSKPDGYGKISQCLTTTKHSKAVTVCIFLGIYCTLHIVLMEQTVSRVWWLNSGTIIVVRVMSVTECWYIAKC